VLPWPGNNDDAPSCQHVHVYKHCHCVAPELLNILEHLIALVALQSAKANLMTRLMSVVGGHLSAIVRRRTMVTGWTAIESSDTIGVDGSLDSAPWS